MKLIIVSIDGPAASGKGAIARYIKKQFNFYHIDSGLLYRKVAKVIFDKKIVICVIKMVPEQKIIIFMKNECNSNLIFHTKQVIIVIKYIPKNN